MSKLYFVGDINFSCDPQLELIRKDIWDDYQSMNEDLISNWNENVGENDTVFVIGTFFNFTSSLTEKKEIYSKLIPYKDKCIAVSLHREALPLKSEEYKCERRRKLLLRCLALA